MKIDIYGQHIFTEEDVCNLYMVDYSRTFKKVLVSENINLSDILDLTNLPEFVIYNNPKVSVQEFDFEKQNDWCIPESYKDFDIAKYVLDLCQTEEELQRAGQELLLYQERGMFPLLVYLKYLVDAMRENNIVWGVGRGSSVASYVLFLIGVHRINSIFYDLSIDEFLR